MPFGILTSNQNFVVNGAFNQGHAAIPVGGYASFSNLEGWDTKPGSAPLELVRDGYNGISAHSGNTGYWLDTQASPGGIDISQTLTIPVPTLFGIVQDKISFDISAENIGGLKTNPNSHFQVLWNNKVVEDVTVAELGDYNHFHHYEIGVQGNFFGSNTLEIRDVGGTPSNVGFAVSNFDVHQDLNLFAVGLLGAHDTDSHHNSGWHF